MKLEGILTQREWEKRVSFDLVYAWEDIFAQELGVPLVPRSRMAEALVRRLPGRQAVPTGKEASAAYRDGAHAGKERL